MHDLGIQVDHFNPNVLYILKQKRNAKSPLTYHCHDFISIIYILSGSCTYTIDGESYAVKKGDLIICNPGVYHGKLSYLMKKYPNFKLAFISSTFNIFQKNV